MRADFLVERCCQEKTTAALVGGGGKTTLMYTLAEQCARRGRKVLVGTTTHIQRPERNFAETAESVRSLWNSGTYAVIGTPASECKLTAAPRELLEPLSREADLILMEADGAKRHPCKVPAGHEPVIPSDCAVVLAVLGMTALGRPMGEVCFRFPQEGSWLNRDADDLLDEETAAKLLSDPRGGRKNVGQREFIAVLNQCDDPVLRRRAGRIAEYLKKENIPAVLTALKPKK